ncbi:MAG: hypothetical protein Q8880_13325 [Bacteroidota bacterium]|nr:hypothetical protein [Bacteroidota bacterium]
MSYDLHITKAEKKWESKNNPITVEEWFTIIDSDPELKHIEKTEFKNPQTQKIITIMMENSAAWNHSVLKRDVPFRYARGMISVSNPDDIIIEKMKEIAGKLNSKVLGDEGEEY